tara:strand:- start:605 stop:1444 length:840 start_codon:yes stop_codon:yes gene_type:complete
MALLLNLKKSIANIFTIINLFLGFFSIIIISLSIYNPDYTIKTACILIFIATIIDVFDGKIARKLGTSGDFGKEIDSLADLVSFCLAPSFMIFAYYYNQDQQDIMRLVLLSSLPLICGAIRLARFNAYDIQSKQNFYLGLPTPSNAIFICSTILFMFNYDFLIFDLDLFSIANLDSKQSFLFYYMKIPFSLLYGINDYIVIIVCSLSSILLLTNIHYAKFPIVKLNLSKKNSFSILGIVIFFIILLYGILNKEYHIVLLFFISLYIVSGIILSIVKKIK